MDEHYLKIILIMVTRNIFIKLDLRHDGRRLKMLLLELYNLEVNDDIILWGNGLID
jgi:hypothetical protein